MTSANPPLHSASLDWLMKYKKIRQIKTMHTLFEEKNAVRYTILDSTLINRLLKGRKDKKSDGIFKHKISVGDLNFILTSPYLSNSVRDPSIKVVKSYV